MSDIYSLLKLNREVLNDFSLQALSVDNRQAERVVNANINRLKQIEDKLLVGGQVKVNPRSIEAVIKKVKAEAHGGEKNVWASHELRTISYYMMKLQSDDSAYLYALELLRKNWRNLYFNGLIFYVMNTWNFIQEDKRESVCKLIVNKLSDYKDCNKRYIKLRDHANFFDENGPIRMVGLLLTRKIKLFDAPTIIGYRQSSLAMSYYSDVIIQYVKRERIYEPSDIEEILAVHQLDRTKKLLFAEMVENAERVGDPQLQTNVCRLASRYIGDVSLTSSWAPFAGATTEDAVKLRKAKQLVNQWFARKVIEVFFEVCVQDPDRKQFWLRYVNMVYDFRIAGSTLVRQSIQRDSRVGLLFTRYFIETNSRMSQTAALILSVKDKVIVEFSDLGSVYVYNHKHENIKFLYKGIRSLSSINDLKAPYLGNLVEQEYYYSYYMDEGKMRHSGRWQQRLSGWISQKLSKDTVGGVSFTSRRDDDVFKERAVTEEDLPES